MGLAHEAGEQLAIVCHPPQARMERDGAVSDACAPAPLSTRQPDLAAGCAAAGQPSSWDDSVLLFVCGQRSTEHCVFCREEFCKPARVASVGIAPTLSIKSSAHRCGAEVHAPMPRKPRRPGDPSNEEDLGERESCAWVGWIFPEADLDGDSVESSCTAAGPPSNLSNDSTGGEPVGISGFSDVQGTGGPKPHSSGFSSSRGESESGSIAVLRKPSLPRRPSLLLAAVPRADHSHPVGAHGA